ncbi:MOSC domain-containing protein [Alteromonas sp. CYL-A6]|uniref:MOSC domain-containing protein n=1 Tax=Alteromonas nitratireducens TaxID=3390813 RepID=UPI0034AFD9BA
MNIHALYAGKPVPFGPRKSPSSIVKSPVAALTVHEAGTDEDEQGNKKLHGGKEKVLHQYSFPGYALMKANFPDGAFEPGSIGENLLVEGMDDTNVYIGDIYQMGEIQVEVGAPRAPCNRISQRYGIKNLDRFLGEHGRTGWYYRVIQTGVLRDGDTVALISRPEHSLTVGALMRGVFLKQPDVARQGINIGALDPEWVDKCERIIRQA